MARHDFRKPKPVTPKLEQIIKGKPHFHYYMRKYGHKILYSILVIETLYILGHLQGIL